MLSKDLLDMLGVGVDVESVAAFRKKKLSKDRAFFRRVFSDDEIRYCQKFADPAPHYTARFCAKEALIKAASPAVKLFVSDMEVHHDDHGTPQYKRRSNRPQTKKFFSQHKMWLSLSHTKDQAIAFAVVGRKHAR